MSYTIKWTEVSTHEATISPAELAALKGVTVAELDAMDDDEITDGLDDQLADLPDDGFEGLMREGIDVCRS